MTGEIAKRLAEVKRAKAEDSCDDKTVAAFDMICTAATSDALVPETDARLAVAEALRMAVALIEPVPTSGNKVRIPFCTPSARLKGSELAVVAYALAQKVAAIADQDALAQVQNMRTMLARALEQNADLKVEARGWREEAEVERARAEAAEAKLAALVEAATPYVQPVQNADYGRQLRQHEALVAALAAAKGGA